MINRGSFFVPTTFAIGRAGALAVDSGCSFLFQIDVRRQNLGARRTNERAHFSVGFSVGVAAHCNVRVTRGRHFLNFTFNSWSIIPLVC